MGLDTRIYAKIDTRGRLPRNGEPVDYVETTLLHLSHEWGWHEWIGNNVLRAVIENCASYPLTRHQVLEIYNEATRLLGENPDVHIVESYIVDALAPITSEYTKYYDFVLVSDW